MSNDDARSRLGHQLYPELSVLATSAERRAMFQQAQRRLFRSWPAWGVAGPVTLGLVWVAHQGRLWALGQTPLPAWLIVVGLGVLLLAYVYYVSTFVFVRRMRRHIREALAERGVAVCMTCGYDLRGLSAERCPECGHASRATPEPRPAGL